MDHLAALRVFVRVAESNSFSRAAEILGLPRASVSAAVQAVETRAGTRLLNRTTRRVALTPDGQAFLDRCRRLLDDVEDMDGLFRQGPDRVGGRLRVSLPERLANRVLIPALPQLLDRHPGLQVDLSVTDRFVDLVADGVDCVIRAGELKDSRLIGRRLGAMVQGTFASPTYLARHGTPALPADLAGHRMIGYVSAVDGLDFAWDGPDGAMTLGGRLAVDSAAARVTGALAGLGLIQAPAYGLRGHVAAGRLVEILPGYRPSPLPLSVLYPHRRRHSPKVDAFIAWAETVLEREGVFAPGP